MVKKSTLLLYVIILLSAVTAAYSNHFYNGFHFDDSHSIYSNPNIRNIKNIPLFFRMAPPAACCRKTNHTGLLQLHHWPLIIGLEGGMTHFSSIFLLLFCSC